MARVTTRVKLNQAAIDQLLRGGTGPVVRLVDTLTRRTANAGKRNCKVDEGHLRDSVTPSVTTSASQVRGRVGTPLDYGYWLHEGTGVYGPRGAPIRPIHRKYLRFEVKSGTAARGRRPVVFAKQVRGVPGDKWLLRALQESVPFPVRAH
jgi:hypothetical protein